MPHTNTTKDREHTTHYTMYIWHFVFGVCSDCECTRRFFSFPQRLSLCLNVFFVCAFYFIFQIICRIRTHWHIRSFVGSFVCFVTYTYSVFLPIWILYFLNRNERLWFDIYVWETKGENEQRSPVCSFESPFFELISHLPCATFETGSTNTNGIQRAQPIDQTRRQ